MGMNNSTCNQGSQKCPRRKNFQPTEKVAILKKHLLEGTKAIEELIPQDGKCFV